MISRASHYFTACRAPLVGLAFVVLAWYHAAGDVIAATFGRNILPVRPPPVREPGR
jgi:succinate-acetate transporter protein